MTQKFKTVAELLEDPKRWIKEDWSRNKKDRPVLPLSRNAICWCLEGAIFKVYRNHKIRCEIVDKIELFINTSIPEWNDAPQRTHKQVLALCKKLDI